MPSPRIVSLETVNPPHRFSQENVLALAGYTDPVKKGFFENSQIEGRYLAIDPERVSLDESIDELSARFREASVELGCRALSRALESAGKSPGDLDFLVTTTCTGRLCPALDAYLIRGLGLSPNIQRVHVGDTGCSSAIVALQQATNYLHAFPGRLAAVVATEVSSTAYFIDDDRETAVANAIFSDGAGAMILATEGEGPAVLGHRTLFRPEHLDLMGFTFPNGRQRILLSRDIRQVASRMMLELTDELLSAHDLTRKDVRHWILHSAGRAVLDRAQEEIGLSDADLEPARTVLRKYGNMSSATVLFVFKEVLETRKPLGGDRAVMVALGPGFAAEGALLRW